MSHASHGRHAEPRTSVLNRTRAAALLGAAAAAASLLAPASAQASTAGTSGASGTSATTLVVTHMATPHFPVPVRIGNAHQVITVQAHGSYAVVTAWQLNPVGWQRVFSTTAARIGAHGLANGATRRQGTYTTPTGTYTITRGFGNGPAPRGTRMPYHRVTSADWWVEDPQSPYYNTLRAVRPGTNPGFPLTEAGDRGSEHLANYPIPYHNALVIDFNMHPAVPGRGAGIFLHDLNASAGPTAGCVAVPASVLTHILQWINPAAHPVIAIG
ncbi:L,D-transpeptidase family protein [Streptacidiphilus jiangxiensis]|uniref:L,D-peptidoglycan transpeptidase YkuD, ErfK/YbiS/YcfS/YnhG family n=1 Tax=Streptacidiphilus jiangxiensis TaxID=235985 RepID=A0A1H7UQ45_STRJI|nr:L,D-transpeptidase family protein [Streptacidiphilus jiangxiensis]SEL98904.1 L,D-peptidoglycan transpeptidase YkuD, ErfK/YbiS/YcfS/YnhG family [Streptacidiphilus jiangxiensis]